MLNVRKPFQGFNDRIEFFGHDRGRDERRNDLHRVVAAFVGLDVDEEFGSGDEACVGGSEEDGGAGDIIGITDTPERGLRGRDTNSPYQFVRLGCGSRPRLPGRTLRSSLVSAIAMTF